MNLSLDNELLIQAIERDRNLAISKIYEESIEKIYRYVYFRVYDEQDAQDVTEEIYLKLMTQLDKYDGKESIKSWIYQIARTKISDFWREKYKIDENFLKEVFFFEEPDKNSKAEERAKEILKKLPENYAKVLELRFLKGYSIKECAEELKTSIENVKVIQHRALKKAGEIL